MFGFKVICWALLFIFKLRFPPGVSIATDMALSRFSSRFFTVFLCMYLYVYQLQYSTGKCNNLLIILPSLFSTWTKSNWLTFLHQWQLLEPGIHQNSLLKSNHRGGYCNYWYCQDSFWHCVLILFNKSSNTQFFTCGIAITVFAR
jgi:hypothetical protein